MRVRGHNGAYDAARPFTIQATVTATSCPGVTLTRVPVTVTAPATGAKTILLTQSARLAGDVAGFLGTPAAPGALRTFAARPEVAGAVVDLAGIPGVSDAYTQWDATLAAKTCPAAANIVAGAIREVIDAYRATNPGLKYVVIAGSDAVIPFYRTPDQSGLGNERDYRPQVLDTTASQASLQLGYVLTQDYYGTIHPISRFDHELSLPDLAVGRLVETIPQMTAVLDAYTATGGVVSPTGALVSGYDFLGDAAAFIADQLAANALTVDRLIQPVGEKATGPNAWTADQLRARLFGAQSYGILSLNGHFSANRLLAADYATRIGSEEIAALPASDQRFWNALVLSTGCHSGYNIVDADATSGTQKVDFPQAFAGRGATLIGGTGFQYGDTDFMKYTEQLLADTVLELRTGTGPVPIGVALANAKRTYVGGLVALRGIDEKALAEATLYGLPMLAFDLPAGSRLAAVPPTTATGLTALTSAGLSVKEITPAYALTRNSRTLAIDGGGTPVQGVYYDAAGSIAVSPGAPVLPQVTLGVGAVGNAVRGVVLGSATYADETGITPFTDVATTEVRGVHPRYVTDVFTPVRPFGLNQFAGANLVSTPFQYRSAAGGSTGTARRFTSETFRVYYSSLTDPAGVLAAAPAIYTVALAPNGTSLTVTATVGGLTTPGIEEVFATYTADSGSLYQSWRSVALTAGAPVTRGNAFARTYTGSIPLGTSPAADVRMFIQAVGGNALVSWATNNGAYYRVMPAETASAATPKASTSLALVAPATATYGATVHLSATLSGPATLAGRVLSFRSGGLRSDATTNASGAASVDLPLRAAPGTATVTVGFVEDATALGSGAEASITVTPAPSAFSAPTLAQPIPLLLGSNLVLTTLTSGGRPLNEVGITLRVGGQDKAGNTDGYGRVRLDSLDGLVPGVQTISVRFAGNDRHLAAPDLSVQIAVYDPADSVAGVGWVLTSGPPTGAGLVPGKRAYFGFGLKYLPGAATPIGAFAIRAADTPMTLVATSFDWLAIAGGTAEFGGTGTVNGTAGYRFRVVAIDGAPDRLAIRIWSNTAGSYDAPLYKIDAPLSWGGIVVRRDLPQPSE